MIKYSIEYKNEIVGSNNAMYALNITCDNPKLKCNTLLKFQFLPDGKITLIKTHEKGQEEPMDFDSIQDMQKVIKNCLNDHYNKFIEVFLKDIFLKGEESTTK